MAGFAHNKGIERRYAAQLAKVAREVGKLAERFVDDVPALLRALKEYAAKLEPWAAQIADRFISEVDKANAKAWAEKSQTIAKALKGDVARSAIGLAAQERHFAQVTLITSLPLEAAARAQKLAEDAARGGKRAGDVREAILQTESVTASRAQLIARTEIAKANAALTEARAQMAGITHYIWRTMQDEDVRESHAALEGQIFAFDAPPVVDEGGAYNPGGVYNCRCFAEPILTQPDAPLELTAPGTTLEQRAAEVATTIARSVAARKAAATRAAKKAETVASKAIAAREAQAVAQVEKGAAALREAAAKAAEKATLSQAGTVSAYNTGKKAATVAAKAGETTMNTVTVTYKVGMNPKTAKTVTKTLPAIDFADLGALRKLLADMPGDNFAIRKAAAEAWNKRLAAKGLHVTEMSGASVKMKGVKWDTTIYSISGNTFTHKDALKAAGARWSGSGWVFTSAEDFHRYLQTMTPAQAEKLAAQLVSPAQVAASRAMQLDIHADDLLNDLRDAVRAERSMSSKGNAERAAHFQRKADEARAAIYAAHDEVQKLLAQFPDETEIDVALYRLRGAREQAASI